MKWGGNRGRQHKTVFRGKVGQARGWQHHRIEASQAGRGRSPGGSLPRCRHVLRDLGQPHHQTTGTRRGRQCWGRGVGKQAHCCVGFSPGTDRNGGRSGHDPRQRLTLLSATAGHSPIIRPNAAVRQDPRGLARVLVTAMLHIHAHYAGYRPLKIHEFQSRDLLERAGIPVPPALLAETADAAADAFATLQRDHGATLGVVKAQVHAGGRGKGGGVKLVRTVAEARDAAAKMLGHPLVTVQTGPEGVQVHRVLVAAGVDIASEYYVGIAVDRASRSPVLIASREGGVEIEEVARSNPDAILRQPFDADAGLLPFQARNVVYGLGLKGKLARQAVTIFMRFARFFLDSDASLAEINPLVVTPGDAEQAEGRVVAIDAKINFDDSALYRHTALAELADDREEDQAEQRAQATGLSYVNLDGDIGCLVNGAGLAMATMDLIKLHGAEPANFLDVGGSATEEAVTEAFRIILDDPRVRGVLVNIFGGIMQCDVIARAIVSAAEHVGFKVPLVVRLEGTNVEEARAILEKAKGHIPTMQIGTDLTDAAKKITA